jgi:hypothetical protein
MRIWSLHPGYLDTKGLVALWRETLLAKHVLEGKTKGYLNHPQLIRFKRTERPLDAIHLYLKIVYEEALKRQHHFDETKFISVSMPLQLTVTKGQLDYELKHLLTKLQLRDTETYNRIKAIEKVITHPLFLLVEGGIEEWELIY